MKSNIAKIILIIFQLFNIGMVIRKYGTKEEREYNIYVIIAIIVYLILFYFIGVYDIFLK